RPWPATAMGPAGGRWRRFPGRRAKRFLLAYAEAEQESYLLLVDWRKVGILPLYAASLLASLTPRPRERRYSAPSWASPLRGRRCASFKIAPGDFVGRSLICFRTVPLDGLSVVRFLQNGGFDFPLDTLAGGGQPVDADRAHAAARGVMGHQPGVELPRSARGEPEQQIDTAFGDGIRAVDALVADDEVPVAGTGARESALLRQHFEKRLDQRLRASPGCRAVLLEQHPARAALDARGNPQAQASGR